MLVREKEKVAGIWINAERMRYPLGAELLRDRIVASRSTSSSTTAPRAIYELGLDSLQLSPASSAAPEEQSRFDAGLVDLRKRGGLYYEAPGAVEITDGVLYRAKLDDSRARAGRAFHRRDLPDPRRPRARGGGAADRHPQVRLRAFRRPQRRSLSDRLRPGGGGAVGAVRLGRRRDLRGRF